MRLRTTGRDYAPLGLGLALCMLNALVGIRWVLGEASPWFGYGVVVAVTVLLIGKMARRIGDWWLFRCGLVLQIIVIVTNGWLRGYWR